MVSCCGIALSALDAKRAEEGHRITAEEIDGQWYITLEHDMSKQHYISFIALASENRVQIVKLYPEQAAEAIFSMGGRGEIYAYCNQDGFFKASLRDVQRQ